MDVASTARRLAQRPRRLAGEALRRTPPLRRAQDEVRRAHDEIEDLRGQVDQLRVWLGQAHGTIREHMAVAGKADLYPPGHFYSPVPDLDAVREQEERIFADRDAFPGIDLRADEQLELARTLAEVTSDQPFVDAPGADGLRYGFRNDYFGYGDGLVLHGMLRHLRPKRLVEVGSGFSSALILDTNDRFLDGQLQCTFIDPYPERLQGLLRPEDEASVRIIAEPVQQVATSVFGELEPGDVLFIDSSHVSKIGSDVNLLLLEVLPALPAGVHVHVHDIVWPFEYSQAWVYEGRAWNEAYLLRALMTDNPKLVLTWFSNYLWAHHAEAVSEILPIWAQDAGTSLWLRTL